jgi:hypothetical protein
MEVGGTNSKSKNLAKYYRVTMASNNHRDLTVDAKGDKALDAFESYKVFDSTIEIPCF